MPRLYLLPPVHHRSVITNRQDSVGLVLLEVWHASSRTHNRPAARHRDSGDIPLLWPVPPSASTQLPYQNDTTRVWSMEQVAASRQARCQGRGTEAGSLAFCHLAVPAQRVPQSCVRSSQTGVDSAHRHGSCGTLKRQNPPALKGETRLHVLLGHPQPIILAAPRLCAAAAAACCCLCLHRLRLHSHGA